MSGTGARYDTQRSGLVHRIALGANAGSFFASRKRLARCEPCSRDSLRKYDPTRRTHNDDFVGLPQQMHITPTPFLSHSGVTSMVASDGPYPLIHSSPAQSKLYRYQHPYFEPG